LILISSPFLYPPKEKTAPRFDSHSLYMVEYSHETLLGYFINMDIPGLLMGKIMIFKEKRKEENENFTYC
jgi:hypothetical protein